MPENTWSLPQDMQALGATQQTVVLASDVTAVKEVDAGDVEVRVATSSLTAAPRGNLTLTFVLRPSGEAGGDPDPNPDPDPEPTGDPTHVKIGTLTFPIGGINPGSTGGTGGDSAYPGYRGPNMLCLYENPPVTITVTNQWGVEVQVGSDNVVDAVNDRQVSQSGTGTSVTSGGYVLSGHGTARDWLLANATVGATVQLVSAANPDPGGGGGGGTPPAGYLAKAVAVYKKVWSNNTAITNVPSGANEIRPAFAQGSPPALTGYTSAGQSSMVAALATRRAAGARIVVSVGGAGGAINTGARADFLSGIASIRSILQGSAGGGLDGIDWDIEASSLNQGDVVWISTQLKALYGNTFGITMAPNGSNVSQYLPCAVALYQAGALDHYAQQFYDATVTLAQAKGRISEALAAGLPQSVMGVGMMIGSDSRHWTNAQCRTYMADIRATWPGITKCYLWMEDDQTGVATTWVADMRDVIGV